MILLALKMLIKNRASFIGVIFGIFLATLLISQQSAIFLGLTSRSYRIVTDNPLPNIWAMDPATESDDRMRGMPDGYLDIVRSIPGVEWAVPMNVVFAPLVTQTGIFEVSMLYGIDDATLIGAPMNIVEGNRMDLRREGGIIVDVYSANGVLAKTLADGTKVPLKVNDTLEINGHRAVVAAISKITPGFYPQPIIFTTFQEFRKFTDPKAQIGFIAAKTKAGANVKQVLKQINSHPGLKGLTTQELKWSIVRAFLRTGILINFGLSVALGMVIGFSIAGQIFYQMTLANLPHFALIKALGGTQKMLLHMIIAQTLVAGVIGFTLGIMATLLWGEATRNTTLAFYFPWELFLFTSVLVLLICIVMAALSIRRVFKVDPKMLMGT